MNGDEMSRGMNQQNRKPNPPKYNEKHSYSPSSNYSYNYNNGYNSNNSGYNGQQQHQRRRPDSRFKPGGHHPNGNDRLVKQNDLIIKLLKEIRDRLPAPPAGSTSSNETEFFEQGQVGREEINETTEQLNDQDAMEDEGDNVNSVDNQEYNPDEEQDSYPSEER